MNVHENVQAVSHTAVNIISVGIRMLQGYLASNLLRIIEDRDCIRIDFILVVLAHLVLFQGTFPQKPLAHILRPSRR